VTSAPETTDLSYRHADGVLSRRVGDSILLLVRQSRELICIDGAAQALWDTLLTPRSARGAAEILAEMYGASQDVVCRDIAWALADLVERGALWQSEDRS
jgi:hypothetical protein